MKVNINIDCTPEEARQFMGLPDVQPLQQAMMKHMEERMTAEVDRFSPENLLKTWFTAMPQNADWMRDVMGGMFSPGSSSKDTKK
ncbi:MAG: DUF6489 family protein [Rhizobiaceae bacterium]|nr:DUF6489 family protein [Rhizobiaceae bacterium]